MVGMIVLVMAGVGLSLLIDKRLQSSSGAIRLHREIEIAEEELFGLREWHQESSRALAERGPQLLAASAALEELQHQQQALRLRQSSAEARRRALLAEIAALEQDFARQRADDRRRTWLAAIGEKIGTLTLRGDREYHEVVITRVTEAGMEIRHQHGIARVLAADLGPKWQSRFHWPDAQP
jgi:hypothetical protein